MAQIVKMRFQVQAHYAKFGWVANVDYKLNQRHMFKSLDEAQHAVKLVQRRFKNAGATLPKLRIISITTEVVEEL